MKYGQEIASFLAMTYYRSVSHIQELSSLRGTK